VVGNEISVANVVYNMQYFYLAVNLLYLIEEKFSEMTKKSDAENSRVGPRMLLESIYRATRNLAKYDELAWWSSINVPTVSMVG
jgi:hypothetical protein